MSLSPRLFLASALLLIAAIPVSLYVIQLSSPADAVRTADALTSWGKWLIWLPVVFGLPAMLVYPPFLPALRCGMHVVRDRLGADVRPLREAQARLRQAETAADHLTAGRVLMQQGSLPAALTHLHRAVEMDPDELEPHYQLARAWQRVGNLSSAADEFSTVLDYDENYASGGALLELSVVLERGGAPARAIEMFDRHRALFGPSPRANFCRARALSQLGRRDEAITALQEAAAKPSGGRLEPEAALFAARATIALRHGGRFE